MFKIKDGYKLELQTPETIKIFRSTKKLIDKTKNGESDVIKRFSWAKVGDKKLIKENDLSDGQYPVNKNIRLNPYANTRSAWLTWCTHCCKRENKCYRQ